VNSTDGRVDRDGWRFIISPAPDGATAGFREQLIEQALAAANGKLAEPLRRSRHASTFRTRVKMIATREVDLFIKLINVPRGLDRFKEMFRESRAAHVARVTMALKAAGFSAPPVLLHGTHRASGCEILATVRSEGYGPIVTLARLAGSYVNKREILRALGAEIGRLHRAGFVHGDLTPFNILIVHGAPPRFTFLDHERTRRNFYIWWRRRQLRNLVQLGRFDLPGVSRTDRLRVFRAYQSVLTGHDHRWLMRKVSAMLQRRKRRDEAAHGARERYDLGRGRQCPMRRVSLS
jgi:hypothetical protein